MLNSSSVATVLVVGFVTVGVMTLSQSVGVILGANIGSTLTEARRQRLGLRRVRRRSGYSALVAPPR